MLMRILQSIDQKQMYIVFETDLRCPNYTDMTTILLLYSHLQPIDISSDSSMWHTDPARNKLTLSDEQRVS